MAIRKHAKGYEVGNLDNEQRGRKLGGTPHGGYRPTNPVTVEQVRTRRGLKEPKRDK